MRDVELDPSPQSELRSDPDDEEGACLGSLRQAALLDGCIGLKIRRTTRMVSGAILKRARWCEQRNPKGGELRIHRIWRPVSSTVRRQVTVGKFLFLSLQCSNPTSHLGAIGARLHWRDVEKFGRHSFRIGRCPSVARRRQPLFTSQ